MKYLYLVLLWLLVAYSDAGHSAEIYKWVGEDGKVYFSDSPPSDVITEKIQPPPAPSIDDIRRKQAATDLLIEQQRLSADQRAQEREEKRLQIAEAERIERLCASQKFGGGYALHGRSDIERFIDENGKLRPGAIEEMDRDIAANCK